MARFVKASPCVLLQPSIAEYVFKHLGYQGEVQVFDDPRKARRILKMADPERPAIPAVNIEEDELEILMLDNDYQGIRNIVKERFKNFAPLWKRQFNWPYKPPWQKRKEILFRRFKWIGST